MAIVKINSGKINSIDFHIRGNNTVCKRKFFDELRWDKN